MTATELMDIVDRFFENISSDPSTKVQDTLNTILQATYPFISEGHEWTMSTTKFDLQVNTVKVKVMPKYVPMEEKDKTTLILGVYIQKKKCQRIFIWRSEDTINVSGYGNYSRKISSETEIVEFSINHFLVISSEGGAAHLKGGVLGQYCYDPDTGFYLQTSTEKGHENYNQPRYISPVDDVWCVGDAPGVKAGALKNPTKSQSLPLVGWMYSDDKTFHADTTLVISPGPLSSLCDRITVSASGPAAEVQSPKLGEFSRTEMWWNGRPVFRNSQGQLLKQSGKEWDVGPNLGRAGLRGSMTHPCPGSEKKWEYAVGREQWKPASVTIDCKVHKTSA